MNTVTPSRVADTIEHLHQRHHQWPTLEQIITSITTTDGLDQQPHHFQRDTEPLVRRALQTLKNRRLYTHRRIDTQRVWTPWTMPTTHH